MAAHEEKRAIGRGVEDNRYFETSTGKKRAVENNLPTLATTVPPVYSDSSSITIGNIGAEVSAEFANHSSNWPVRAVLRREPSLLIIAISIKVSQALPANCTVYPYLW